MSRQLSTSLSDFVLSSSAIWSYLQLKQAHNDFQFGKWWFMLQAIAASLGVLKFGRFAGTLQEKVDKYHKNFSWLCATVGIPCFGSQFCLIYGYSSLSKVSLILAVSGFIIGTRKAELRDIVPVVTSPFIIFALIFIGYTEENHELCCACLLFILAVAIGDEGKFYGTGIFNADIFHYILVIINILSVYAIFI